MISKLVRYLVLPGAVSDFEQTYLRRMNRVGFLFLACHVPLFIVIAALNGQSMRLAAELSSLVLVGPAIAVWSLKNPRWVGVVHGIAAMLMGGLLVHFGQGPVQIEMHFYFFAMLALLAVYANPLAIAAAAVTVALHHLLLWLYLPNSVFNYDASLWVVLVHAAFVVVESIATCFIARSFFDNVIGLEKIVEVRTAQLDARNRDMRLVLDTVHQGFLTVDRSLQMSSEMSAAVSKWFGAAQPGQTLMQYLSPHDASFVQRFELGWDQVVADFLPLELTLDQLPKRLEAVGRQFSVDYNGIQHGDAVAQVLVMISDITAHVERQRLEAEQHDVMEIMGRVAKDKSGVLEFVREASGLVQQIAAAEITDLPSFKRNLHTLKGNAMIFGVQSISHACHAMENFLEDGGTVPSLETRATLQVAWHKLRDNIAVLLGSCESALIEIDDSELETLLHAVLRGESSDKLVRQLRGWKLEPTARRLMRAAEQAQSVATRLQKSSLHVTINDHALRLDPKSWSEFWSVFVHVVRNAVDHGIEDGLERAQQGKPAAGRLSLGTRLDGEELVIEIEDDGRGVDWDRIAQRAASLGLPHATHDDLVEAMFSDGLSTRSEVSEYSGRGVGMSAVRAACRARSGDIRVWSEPTRGTRIEFRFPGVSITPPAIQQAG